jgi:putative transcriptional regulator
MTAETPGQRPGDERFGGRLRSPAAGMLLVATPMLTDPNFRRTVVYLIAHHDEGSAGLILNRRTETAVHNVLPGWTSQVSRPQALYAGGPVQTSGAMCLGVSKVGVDPADVDGVVRVAGSVVLVDLDSDPEATGHALSGVRIFAGHAGWAEGQLEEEIDEGAWYVLPCRPGDVLVGPRTDLWFEVLRRQGFPLAWDAYRPRDPDDN